MRDAAEDLEAVAALAVDEGRLVGVLVAHLRVAAQDAVVRHEDVVRGLKDNGLFAARRGRRDGGAGDDELRGRAADQRELEQRARGLGRLKPHAHQVQEGDEVLIRHLVEPIDDHLGHPREQLDERDARVGRVKVRPLGAVLRDEALRLLHDLLVRAVVQVGDGDHGVSSRRR